MKNAPRASDSGGEIAAQAGVRTFLSTLRAGTGSHHAQHPAERSGSLRVTDPAARLAFVAEADLDTAGAAARAAELLEPVHELSIPTDHARKRIDRYVPAMTARPTAQLHARFAVIGKSGQGGER